MHKTFTAALLLALSLLLGASQSNLVLPSAGPMPMSTFVSTHLNPALLALASCNSGTSAPTAPSPVAGQCWINTTTPTAWSVQIYDGTNWIETGKINTTANTYSPTITGTAITALSGSGTQLVTNVSPALITPALGTPSALVLTNATGLPIAGITGFGSGLPAWFATPSSANLKVAVTDETGTGGALVFSTSPVLTTPNLGTPSAIDLANATNFSVGAIGGLGTGVATWLAAPSSANLYSALTDKSGTGLVAFNSTPLFGGATLGGPTNVSGSLRFGTQSIPTQITANQNDYNPGTVNCQSSSTLLISSDAARDITGLAAPTTGCRMTLNNTGNFNITLKELNGGSTAGNQFNMGGDLVLAPKASVTLFYEGTSAKWRNVSSPVSGAGSGTVTSVACGTGLTGGTFTTAGTCAVNYGTANSWTANNNFTGGLQVGGQTISAAPIVTGNYVPTYTAVTNIDSTTTAVTNYYRIGDMVTVAGRMFADPTAASVVTTFRMSLPIASTFTSVGDCAGVASVGGATPQYSAAVSGNVANNNCQFDYTPNSANTATFWFHFTYKII